MALKPPLLPNTATIRPRAPISLALTRRHNPAIVHDAVRNNAALSRFELDIDGAIAFANYRVAGRVITFTHTEVPPQLRKRGFATKLAYGALVAVRARGLKVVPRCSFIAYYMEQHPDLYDLLA